MESPSISDAFYNFAHIVGEMAEAQLRKAEMLKALRLKQLFEFRFKYFVQYVIGLLFIFKQIRNR